MGANSNISWTHHTFNPWWGCEKISPGCAHCYADSFAVRCGYGGEKGTKAGIWGRGAARRFFGDEHWNEPVGWNAEAGAANAGLADHAPFGQTRPRVFCASMADVFEDRPDLVEHRQRLRFLIDGTPHLDWLLLTKRPENVRRLMEEISNGNVSDFRHMPNVWLGTTVENQEMADRRIPELLKIPARVRFLSVEPMLEEVRMQNEECQMPKGIDWVICGGESGPRRRAFEIDWAESLAAQCTAAGVPFFFKQDGGLRAGQQGRVPDGLWQRKEFPGGEMKNAE